MRIFVLRWLYLIVGGALIMPFVVLMTVALGTGTSLMAAVVNPDPIVFLASLPLVAGSGFFPPVRAIEVPMARALLGGPAQSLDPAGRGDRLRVALYWFLHLVLGGVVSAATLAIPPAAVLLLLTPVAGDLGWTARPAWIEAVGGWMPALGAAMLAGTAGLALLSGRSLAWLAPRLLGPSPTDQITALQRTAEHLAERNRLARELHDSIGHTLSVVMLQAGAAGRVLDTDPAFVRKALTHIEEAARDAQSELDGVLGLLRFGLDHRELVARASRAGIALRASVSGDERRIPPDVAHDLHQIVREGLTNVLRHAGQVPAMLRIEVHESDVEVTLANTLGPDAPPRHGGGRGLLGIRERVGTGQMEAGESGGQWRLFVRLHFGASR